VVNDILWSCALFPHYYSIFFSIDGQKNEIEELREKISNAQMSKEALEHATEELDKLEYTPSYSPEYTVILNYLDWLISIPWSKKAKDKKMGARGLRSVVEDLLLDIMFKVPSMKNVQKVILTEDFVNGKEDAVIMRKQRA